MDRSGRHDGARRGVRPAMRMRQVNVAYTQQAGKVGDPTVQDCGRPAVAIVPDLDVLPKCALTLGLGKGFDDGFL